MKRGVFRYPMLIAVVSCVLLLLMTVASLAALPWHDSGGPLTGADVLALAYDANHNLLYAGVATGGGVWACGDPYTNPQWVKISGAPNIGNYEVRSLAYDPQRNLLYAAAYDNGTATGRGVWRCSNPQHSSRTWAHISSGAGAIDTDRISSLELDRGHNLLFAGLYSGKVWRAKSPSGSATWESSVGSTYDLEYDATRNVLYAGTNASGVMRTSTPDVAIWATTPWTQVTPVPPMSTWDATALALDEGRNILYAGFIDTGGPSAEGVHRCTGPSGGAPSWTKISGAGDVGDQIILSLLYDAVRNRLYCGPGGPLGGMWTCSNPNASFSWTEDSGILGSDVCSSLAMTQTGSALFAGTQNAGVWYTVLANPTWYLAEGSTAWGFDTYISIQNPNSSAVTCTVTYMPTGAANVVETVNLPAASRLSISPRATLGSADFSTRVECNEGRNIAVDRTMTWLGTGATVQGAHNSVGVIAPSETWYLPEGSSQWGFESWLLIQNPNGTDANCMVTYMIEGEGPLAVPKVVPANSRATFNMADDIGAKDASIQVDSDRPVIPERAMYRNNRREGHDSIGTVTPAPDYYLAEGTSAWGFTTYVLIQNPNPSEASVDVTYMTASGPVLHPENPIVMPGSSRKTIRVNDYLPDRDFSTRVSGDQPIIAERAMYWATGPARRCTTRSG
ncbi:MAG: hypothetical protein KJ993_12845 [Actinobacteria bacterium]|nr:hypothetical protein [Actinomycetota bacterium]